MHRRPHRFCLLWRPLVLLVVLLAGSAPVGRAQAPAMDPQGGATWLAFDGKAAPALATLKLLKADSTAIDLVAELPGAWTETVRVGTETYTWLGGEGYGHGEAVGLPDLPVLRGTVEVPAGAEVTVEVLGAETVEVALSEKGLHSLYPLQPPVPKLPDQEEPPFVIDRAFYAQDTWYPEAAVGVRAPHQVRGHRLVTVEVWPVVYNPAQGRLRLTRQLTLRLQLRGSDVATSVKLQGRYRSPAFEARLEDQVLNYNLGRKDVAPLAKTAEGYLIITADAFYNAVLPFKTLLEGRGFTVTVTRQSQISNGNTTAGIRQYILTAYQSWSPAPSYLLLVGDTDTIPAWPGLTGSHYTDLYYATMDGETDWHPDLYRGRWPVRTAAQAEAVVDKYLDYAGLTGSETWLNRAAFVAVNDGSYWSLAEGTHNYVIGGYTAARGYVGTFPNNPQAGGDRLYAHTYQARTGNVIQAVNGGRALVVYSGHGSQENWSGPFFDYPAVYGIPDVYAITNTESLAFVGSHACFTGNFSVDECFGEAWLRKENGGAIAFWGATNYTCWGEDDTLERAMFDRLFDCGRSESPIGEVTDVALDAVEADFTDMARYYREEYNILGDPSLVLPLPEAPPPVASAVSPSSGFFFMRVPVEIRGEAFCGAVTAYLGDVQLEAVQRKDATTLSAYVPRYMDLGTYDLRVVNGDGKQVILTNAYTVTEAPYVYYLPLIRR